MKSKIHMIWLMNLYVGVQMYFLCDTNMFLFVLFDFIVR